MSDSIKIVNFANEFVFEDCFKEWQVQVILINVRVYGSLLYSQKEIKEGIKFFLDYHETHQDMEFQEMFLFLCTELCKNLDPAYTAEFLDNISSKLV